MNAEPLPKIQAKREFFFIEDNFLMKKLSSFPVSLEVEYQQPVDGISDEDEEEHYDYNKCSFFPLKLKKSAGKVKSRTNKKAESVNFNNLNSVLLKSKAINLRAGTACFEVFKSLKVISLVSSYMNDE
jgi:hypothetical protein